MMNLPARSLTEDNIFNTGGLHGGVREQEVHKYFNNHTTTISEQHEQDLSTNEQKLSTNEQKLQANNGLHASSSLDDEQTKPILLDCYCIQKKLSCHML